MSAARMATVVRPGEGQAYWLLGDLVTIKLSGEQTDGRYAVVETTAPPSAGPPPHLHRREDEMFAILEGEFGLIYGDQTLSAKAADTAYLPKNIPHTYKNVGSMPGRMLVVATPCGFEKFVPDAGLPAVDRIHPLAVNDAAIGKLMGATPRYGIEMLMQHQPTKQGGSLPKPKEYWLQTSHVVLNLTSEQTAGNFCVATATFPSGAGMPLHLHTREDDMFYVLEGTLTVTAGGREFSAPRGTFVHIPRGIVHSILNSGNTPAKFLSYHTPGGFEKFLMEAGYPCADVKAGPPQFDPEKIKSLAGKHGMELK